MALKTNREGRTGGLSDAIKGADALLAMSSSGPGVVSGKLVETMNDEAIVFACANPIPEIWPWEAKEAGARIVWTGRTDFPNQVNNFLGFPGIFTGTLGAWGRVISDGMCIAASNQLCTVAEVGGLDEKKMLA